ncbi:DUF7289 family protein [Halorubrum amylolyticum]|uniref:DUF7289 family protein n=1 Tax=Halorubrum amylolyticum TaxID=2508724 RepID=UPI0010087B5C|nr:archaellin/type IV pilin N-terminal domain-containing protein [Halorubrum amylolyticum]
MNRPERAQSEVIGAVLLLGLTITAIGVTAGIGSTALSDAQSSAEIERIEGAMTQVDAKASLVAHGGSPSQRVRLDPGRSTGVRVDGEAGLMRIEVETEDGTDTEEVRLGTVVYERGDDRVAYQGGGVWRSNGDGAWMVSPPEFHYRGDTLTLPLVTIDGDERLDDSAVVTSGADRPDGVFPSDSVSNPLLGGNVTITVESEYAEAWGRFFESRTEANVTQLSQNEVRVALRTETVHPAVSASVSAVGQSKLALGNVTSLYADSYDSSRGPYDPDDPGSEARLRTNGKFHLAADGGGPDSLEVRGDVEADSFNPSTNSNKWTRNTEITGELIRSDESVEPIPVSGAITEGITAIRGLELDETGDYRDDAEFDGTDHVIDEDTYVADDIEVSDGDTLRIENGATVHVGGGLNVSEGGRVVFDSGGGDIGILLEDDLSAQGDGAIDSVGGGTNSLYVDGGIDVQDRSSIGTDEDTRFDLYNTGEIDVSDEARIAADGDVARNLWLYSNAGEIEIEGDEGDGVEFAGVLYAPESNVELEDRMTFKGSFTSEHFGFDDADLSFHYDESLRGSRPFGGESVPVVSNLHVSAHRVTIESD